LAQWLACDIHDTDVYGLDPGGTDPGERRGGGTLRIDDDG
jgi:hypothetical protein